MNISGIGGYYLLQEMASMRLQASDMSGSGRVPATAGEAGEGFSDVLSRALDGVSDAQNTADDLRTRFDLGDRSLSLSDVMISAQKASLSFEAAVQVRNRFVDAYRSIMQMQV